MPVDDRGSVVTMAPEQLAFLYEARGASAVLEASLELGVLDHLEGAGVDAPALAGVCGITVEAARALLVALAGLGLAEPDGQGGFVAPAAGRADPVELVDRWTGLAETLREGTGRATHPLSGFRVPPAAVAAERLAGTGPRILDLGAGSADWSLAFVRRDPACHVTAVDLPSVIPSTRAAVTAAGHEDRYRFIGGDLFTVTVDDGAFDLVIAGYLCRSFDDAANRRLAARAARWLAPGGVVALIDVLPNERLDGPRGVTLYAVDLARREPAGRLHPFSSYATWLRTAGFEKVERVELAPYPPITLVRAQRA